MPQHAIFWLSIALFMIGFAVKYKLEHRSMSSGTMLHVSETQSKDARTACKRIIKKGGKENKK